MQPFLCSATSVWRNGCSRISSNSCRRLRKCTLSSIATFRQHDLKVHVGRQAPVISARGSSAATYLPAHLPTALQNTTIQLFQQFLQVFSLDFISGVIVRQHSSTYRSSHRWRLASFRILVKSDDRWLISGWIRTKCVYAKFAINMFMQIPVTATRQMTKHCLFLGWFA